MPFRKISITVGCTLFLFGLLSNLAADEGVPAFRSAGNKNPVQATLTSPAFINSVPHPISENKPIRKYHKDPFKAPADKLALLKTESFDPANPRHLLDKASSDQFRETEGFVPCKSFQGVLNTGWNPPDPDLAVGPNHIVAVVNSSVAIYDKMSGALLLQSTAAFWFQNTVPPPPSGFIFDPKVVYDPHAGRFIILYLCTDDISQASYLVSVSQTSDAMGNWYSYNLNAAMDGEDPSGMWPDYPGLGYDFDEAVYITSNQWIFNGGYAYAKIRILDKAVLYSGGPISWNDIWDIKYHDGSTAFTVKPAETYNDADGEFLLSNIWYGANYTTYWKITSPLTLPVVTRKSRVNLASSYSFPPEAQQKGGAPTVGLIGPMTQEVIFRNGKVYTTFDQSFNWGSGTVSAIRILGIDTASSTAAVDNIFGANGVYYHYPAIYADPSGRIFLSFSRSSTSEYISLWYVEDLLANPQSNLLKAGENHQSGASPIRWGDYCGIAGDPVDQNLSWIMHEYAPASSTSWRNWIGQIPSRITRPILYAPQQDAHVTLPALLRWDTLSAAPSYQLQIDDDTNFVSPAIDVQISTNQYSVSSLTDRTVYYWRVQGVSACPGSPWSYFGSFKVCDYINGDADGSGTVNITDVVRIIGYIFSGGPAPIPLLSGDTICDAQVNITDVVFLIHYIFNGGLAPCNDCE